LFQKPLVERDNRLYFQYPHQMREKRDGPCCKHTRIAHYILRLPMLLNDSHLRTTIFSALSNLLEINQREASAFRRKLGRARCCA
jgi:hypothetical protein